MLSIKVSYSSQPVLVFFLEKVVVHYLFKMQCRNKLDNLILKFLFECSTALNNSETPFPSTI